MSSAQKQSSHESLSETVLDKRLDPDAAPQCRHTNSDHQPQSSSPESNAKLPEKQQSRPVQVSNGPMLASPNYFDIPSMLEDSALSTVATSSGLYFQHGRSPQAALPPLAWPSGGTMTPGKTQASPFLDGDISETAGDNKPEPASKRYKLSDDGWIEEALKRGQEERGAPDPYPMPQLTQPGRLSKSNTHLQPKDATIQPRVQPPAHWLSPSDSRRSPTILSATPSRRPSSAYSTSSPSHSPALTHRSNISANRHGPPSPTDGSIMGGFSDLEIGSRANSRVPDGVDCQATFSHVHGILQAELQPRMTPKLSKLEQLPKQIFMRIMMYCGYKTQVLLRRCNYNLYVTVDLAAIPWEEKTSTILFEERNNPKNFPKKPSKSQEGEESGLEDDEETDRIKRATKRKRPTTKATLSSPKRTSSKNKAHIDTYGRWGCYCCYKVLPAHYFEGALLEDKEGRTPKSNKLRAADGTESDKKIDMRVEYIQILGAVPGARLPAWLSQENENSHATDMKSFLLEKMERGVNCDDLRAYYRHITRDTHLVAPIRGITPIFEPSITPVSSAKLNLGTKAPRYSSNISPRTIRTPPSTIQTRQEAPSNTEEENETSRPLYKLQTGNITQVDGDSASYTYEIPIPRNAERGTRSLLLPETEPISRIVVPPRSATAQEPLLSAGDVVPLRRICIPCGTRYAVYRRSCNRKIVSKTGEQWWVCDCPEVRLAGRSTGCATCGRKVIY